jgi:hypothetical protein
MISIFVVWVVMFALSRPFVLKLGSAAAGSNDQNLRRA